MNRLAIMILLMRSFMLCAIEGLPQEYAVGKNVRLSLQARRAHLLNQARISNGCLDRSIKKMLRRAASSPAVLNDLAKRNSSIGNRVLGWDALEDCLKKSGREGFYLFGFGSLMNKQTNYQPNINIPGVVFGVKRMYNLEHADPEDSVLGLPTLGYEHERLRLNVQLTKRPTDMVNGLLLKFAIGTKSYEDLKKREKLYRLVSVKVLLYSSLFQRKPIFEDAYILVGDKEKNALEGDPHIVYNSLVIDGCKELEDDGAPGFLSLFLDTTYLSDGKTRVREWIRRNSSHAVSD